MLNLVAMLSMLFIRLPVPDVSNVILGNCQNFRQGMNLHKSDVRTLNTDCLVDLHINWCLNIKYEHLKIPYFYCMPIYYSSSAHVLGVRDQRLFP